MLNLNAIVTLYLLQPLVRAFALHTIVNSSYTVSISAELMSIFANLQPFTINDDAWTWVRCFWKRQTNTKDYIIWRTYAEMCFTKVLLLLFSFTILNLTSPVLSLVIKNSRTVWRNYLWVERVFFSKRKIFK